MKRLSSCLILIALLTSACGLSPFGDSATDEGEQEIAQVAEDATNEEASSESNTEAEPETPTATPVSETETESAASTEADDGEMAQASCNVDPLGLPQNLNIAGSLDTDWLKGDAVKDSITIVEYGDFQ